MIARQVESTIERPGAASGRTRALASNPRRQDRPCSHDVAGDRPARVLLLGCGTVGSVVARHLLDAGDSAGVQLTRVLVRDRARARSVPTQLLTTSFEDAIDEDPDLVIEVLGGEHPACEYVCESLRRGIPVVTANKTLVARHGLELDRAAQEGGARLVHEAAACAAIPVFAALRHLEGDRVRRIVGIVNGSCNYILTRMSKGATYEAALAEAGAKGLVEPDPSADIMGRDSAEKLLLLVRAADPGAGRLRLDDIEMTGISGITREDILAARQSGYVIKLVAEYDRYTGMRRVGPTWVSRGHVLADVNDEENAVLIDTELAGEILLRGKGAGPKPTASAILGDIGRVLSEQPAGHARSVRRPSVSMNVEAVSRRGDGPSDERLYYVRVARTGLSPDEVLHCLSAHEIGTKEITIASDGVRGIVRSIDASKVTSALGQLGDSSLLCPIWNRTA